MDGLNVVVPFGERNYYNLRPTIAIRAPGQRTIATCSVKFFHVTCGFPGFANDPKQFFGILNT